jgi:hypothetical protein
MMNKTEKDIAEDLLDVLAAAMVYVEVKSTPANPFVRKLGEAKEEAAAFEMLKKMVENSMYLLPEIESLADSRLSSLQAEKPSQVD